MTAKLHLNPERWPLQFTNILLGLGVDVELNAEMPDKLVCVQTPINNIFFRCLTYTELVCLAIELANLPVGLGIQLSRKEGWPHIGSPGVKHTDSGWYYFHQKHLPHVTKHHIPKPLWFWLQHG